jgi:cytochrome-b5 reductase
MGVLLDQLQVLLEHLNALPLPLKIGSAVIVIITTIYIQKLHSKQTSEDVSLGLRREMSLTSSTALNNLDKTADVRVIHPINYTEFTITRITNISHNTKLIRFAIPNNKTLGLSIGRHISIKAMINDVKVMRSYTPTSLPNQQGFFELLIKIYADGKMSQYIDNLKSGDRVEVRGPIGRFKYNINSYKRIGLIAAGTGLTPCLQLIRCILQGPDYSQDTTTFCFFFQNRTERDILLKAELDALQSMFEKRLEIHYFVSNPSASFGKLNPYEHKGYIGEADINTHLTRSKCEYVGLCGPNGFNESMIKLLKEAGHEVDNTLFVW